MGNLVACDDSEICAELRGIRDGVGFHATYNGDPPSRVVAASENFTALVDLAPLTAGHLLLVPRQHIVSFGHVPTDIWDELEGFRDDVVDRVRDTYGPPIIVEHGSSSDLRYSACVSHAHWHVIPTDAPMLGYFERDGLGGRQIASARDLRDLAERDQSYIYFHRPEGGDHWVFEENLSKRGQYLRMVLAEHLELDDPDWDWGVVQRKDLLRATVARLNVSGAGP